MVIVLDYGLHDFPKQRKSFVNMENVKIVEVDRQEIQFFFIDGTTKTVHSNQAKNLYDSVLSQLSDWSWK